MDAILPPLLATPLPLVHSSLHPSSTSSSASSGKPGTSSPEAITPPPLFDFQQFIDPDLLMSPSTARAPLIHSASYTYGEQPHPGELSQVRSTAGLETSSTTSDPATLPQVKAELSSSSLIHEQYHGTMLPPIRSTEAHASIGSGYYSPYPPAYSQYSTYSYPPYPQYPPGYRSHASQPYSGSPYGQVYPYPHHSSQTPTSVVSHQDVYSSHSAHGGGGSGTIQPSAFGGWSDHPRRVDTTIPGHLLGPVENDRMDERRQSASTNSDGRDDLSKWDIKASPMLSIGHFSDSDGDTTGTMPAPGKMTKPKSKKKMSKKRDGPYREGNITYTTDAEVKQTPELKRMCYNCGSKSPPSWRKSVLNDGRILCNKCGIFERTHRRARPPQNDDQKLRKGVSHNYRREVPPPLSIRPGPESPLSPYSSVPSQATPLSAEFSFGAYQHHHHASMPPPSAVSQDASSADSLLTTARLVDRRHSQAHVYSHTNSSPYGVAWARRTASYNTTPTLSSLSTSSSLRGQGGLSSAAVVAPLTAPPPGGSFNYWDTNRRGSDGMLQPDFSTTGLSSTHNGEISSPSPAPP
ncbi:hypothetical protein DB88DRAFT_289661 [Papiliotrema laurentii]|uniref:GATA-type domain-containing protein n=1 Tax=Papiliotrema laurentii TaxID=5418 RepID=A0AAD9L6K5_PAPLA|nr:hypothetical protein DB88DRAFT_289661 [Papiliotrema laurentii]